MGRIVALASVGEEGGEELDEIELRPQEGRGAGTRWVRKEADQIRPKAALFRPPLYVFPLPFSRCYFLGLFLRVWVGVFHGGWEEGGPHFDGRIRWAYLGVIPGRGQEG